MAMAQGVKLPRVPEKQVQSAIVKLLRSLGAKVYVLGHPSPNDGRTFRGTAQTPGLPDLLVYLGKGLDELTVEVKARGGKLRPAQVEFEYLRRNAGQDHLVGGVDEVVAWLTAHGYLKG